MQDHVQGPMREPALARASCGRRRSSAALALALALALACCLPESSVEPGARQLTVYGFSVLKEPLETSIFPAFVAKWKREHGQDLKITASFAGSETITNQILQGVDTDVAILSIERDAERLREGGAVSSEWRSLPHHGIVNRTPFVIVVRAGNPKGIRDFPDLGKEGVQLIHPDPVSSGGAQWSLLALYGSELIGSEKRSGRRDPQAAESTLRAIWKNVISTPGSAREARTQFETGFGDALVTYELEGLQLVGTGAPFEIVVPSATILSEHVAVLIDRSVTAAERPLAEAFLAYLWSREAQTLFVQHHFRAVIDEELNRSHAEFARIETPFTVSDLGGWARAYPDIVEGVWRERVQKSK